ncbi:MAG: FHA domain-containing protein [Anaerolineae bacterium]|nr:FHA domain-containing protein [Anaerolineae bacterium]MCX8068797.1 FHA domain-containing protein [Anaerolineae bacterium]MDW7990739.1 FHA domain-containing protein [Anaerolineae bacterium]
MERSDYPMLVILEGETAGQRWVLREETVLIGRGADCDIVLPERQISRHHAQIERTPDGRYLLRDLGSKNGTFVNGEEVRETPRELRDGDEIQFAFCVRMSFVGSDATVPLAGEGPVRGLRVDRAGRRVFVGGRELTPPLSPPQYRFLLALLDAQGQVVSREAIIRAVWPDEDPGGISDQAIDALVRRLRARLAELDPAHEYIVTVRGHGFRLENR